MEKRWEKGKTVRKSGNNVKTNKKGGEKVEKVWNLFLIFLAVKRISSQENIKCEINEVKKKVEKRWNKR